MPAGDTLPSLQCKIQCEMTTRTLQGACSIKALNIEPHAVSPASFSLRRPASRIACCEGSQPP